MNFNQYEVMDRYELKMRTRLYGFIHEFVRIDFFERFKFKPVVSQAVFVKIVLQPRAHQHGQGL